MTLRDVILRTTATNFKTRFGLFCYEKIIYTNRIYQILEHFQNSYCIFYGQYLSSWGWVQRLSSHVKPYANRKEMTTKTKRKMWNKKQKKQQQSTVTIQLKHTSNRSPERQFINFSKTKHNKICINCVCAMQQRQQQPEKQ